tara:strand:- start:228 stop:422 length:195 start_codon:yes stop_codon:yes gene_type:complete
MEKSTYKRIAENLAMQGYREELENFEIDAIHIALDAVMPVSDDAAEFRAKLRKAHRADPWYHAA